MCGAIGVGKHCAVAVAVAVCTGVGDCCHSVSFQDSGWCLVWLYVVPFSFVRRLGSRAVMESVNGGGRGGGRERG